MKLLQPFKREPSRLEPETDVLMADIDIEGNDIYTYPALFQGTCVPVLPDTIRISSQFCANHLPRFLYDPDFLRRSQLQT